jgi:hypothetical protein
MSNEYSELVISGSFHYVKGLLRGLSIGSNFDSEIIFNKEHNIECESFKEILKEFIGLSDNLDHVIVKNVFAEYLKVNLTKENSGVEIKSIKKIISAQFEFKFEAYAKIPKQKIDAILKKLPGNLRFSDDTLIKEKIDKDAKGLEIYTPTHDYEYSGKGEVIGSFAEIFEVYKKALNEPLIEVEKMKLIF